MKFKDLKKLYEAGNEFIKFLEKEDNDHDYFHKYILGCKIPLNPKDVSVASVVMKRTEATYAWTKVTKVDTSVWRSEGVIYRYRDEKPQLTLEEA